MIKASSKCVADLICILVAFLPAVTSWAERLVSHRSDCFHFWAHTFALLPGLPGDYLRKGYYRWTLKRCGRRCQISFLSRFTDRRAELGDGVYIGANSSLGWVTLGDGCLVGSRVSVLSGGSQHSFDENGRLTPFDESRAEHVWIGQQTWIGEAAVLMADVGARCIVAAGSVVSDDIPDGCIVGGVPARFIAKSQVATTNPDAPEPREAS